MSWIRGQKKMIGKLLIEDRPRKNNLRCRRGEIPAGDEVVIMGGN